MIINECVSDMCPKTGSNTLTIHVTYGKVRNCFFSSASITCPSRLALHSPSYTNFSFLSPLIPFLAPLELAHRPGSLQLKIFLGAQSHMALPYINHQSLPPCCFVKHLYKCDGPHCINQSHSRWVPLGKYPKGIQKLLLLLLASLIIVFRNFPKSSSIKIFFTI